MSERRDEIEAAVDSIIHDVSAVQAALVVQVTLELIVDVRYDGVEAEKHRAETHLGFSTSFLKTSRCGGNGSHFKHHIHIF